MLKPTDFYLYRTPAFSYEDLHELDNAIINKDIISLKNIYSNTYFLNALFFASKDFYHVTKNWLNNISEFDPNDKVLISLYKYYNRICVRSTPYGLFAGFATGKTVEGCSAIVQDGKNLWEFYIRPDMSSVERLIAQINTSQNSKFIKFSSNNTIYNVADKLRYIEADLNKNYTITQVQDSELLESLLKFTENGQYLTDIKKFITNNIFDVSDEEISSFIDDLISSQLLIPQLPPYITANKKILNSLQENFSHIPNLENELKKLDNVCFNIKSTLNNGADISDSTYYKNQNNFSDQDFQVDLKINLSKNQLNNKVVNSLTKTVNELLQLPNAPHHSRISDFKTKFTERFGTEEISLVHALDPQMGVGYDLQISGNVEDVPLISDIDFSLPEQKKSNVHHSLVSYVQKKFQSNFNHIKLSPIVLEESDIKNNISGDNSKRMFSDYYLMGELSASNMECLDSGQFKFYCTSAIPRPFMATVLSRFSYYDSSLAEKVRNHINKDNNSIIAEIVHQPDGRIGNILLRPSFYKHEIAYYSQPNPDNYQISVNDLLISIVDDEIILRSEKLDQIIIPRLSSSHNFHIAQLPFYRFICDLQYYNMSNGFEWDWGHLKDSLYLPRVEYKNLILCEAKWQLFFYDGFNIQLLKEKIKELSIPRYFKIKDSDNTLLLDSNNIVCLNILLKRLKDKKKIHVYELIDNSFFITHGTKHYFSEVIIPLVNEVTAPSKIIKKEKKAEEKRFFFPGEEWAYFKIYCSHATCDELIAEVLPNLQIIFETENLEWFFIRYDDPNHHLRLRIKSADSKKIQDLLLKELDFYIQNRLIFSVSQDTYEREIERYGSDSIENSESLFYYDSVCSTQLLNFLKNNDAHEEIRYLMALMSVDRLFEDFGIIYEERKKIMDDMFHAFQSEFVEIEDRNLKKDFKKSIDKKLRNHKEILHNLLIDKDYDGSFVEINKILTDRTHSMAGVVNQLLSKFSSPIQRASWLSSFIHMNLNRIFFTHARLHETVIYFLLYKTYVTHHYRKSNQ